MAISRELLVQFGPNKNQRKGYSVHRLFVIVSGSFGSLVTSQVTICKFYFRNIYVISHELLVQFGLNKNKLIASIGLSS